MVRLVWLLLLASQLVFGATNQVTVYEVDGSTQTNRNVTFGRVFAKGEIANYPQPVIGGTPATSYQCDVKNRWDDNSVRFAICSVTQTLSASGSATITFQNASNYANGCTGGTACSYLTQAQMTGFNSGNWDAQVCATPPGGSEVCKSAKTMLGLTDPASNTYSDCKNDYWLQGPQVTAVIVQDCTASFTYDFGWQATSLVSSITLTGSGGSGCTTGNTVTITPTTGGSGATATANVSGGVVTGFTINTGGGGYISPPTVAVAKGTCASTPTGTAVLTINKMAGADGNDATAPYTTTSNFASLHPMFILYFYPGTNNVKVEAIMDNMWSTRRQDQSVTLTFKGGTAPATIYTSTSPFTMLGSTRARKVFWSMSDGSSSWGGPGVIRYDHNWEYMKSTKLFPNYDPNAYVAVNGFTADSGRTPWSTVVTGDKCDIGGTCSSMTDWNADFDSNSELAPMQREELQYLRNMDATTSIDSKGCGDANSACAMAWQILTGESGAIDTSLTSGNVTGGAGMWSAMQNVPFHNRESRTTATGQISTGNAYYCANLADINATPTGTTTCGTAYSSGGTNDAFGKSISMYTHSNDEAYSFNSTLYPVASVGTLTYGSWLAQGGCPHWWDLFYVPYLITGSPYYLEEENFSVSYCIAGAANTNVDVRGRAGFFGFPVTQVPRAAAASIQAEWHAAAIAPDRSGGPCTNIFGQASTESGCYAESLFASFLSMMAGVENDTSTSSITPSTTYPTCSTGANINAWNRWNWGRCVYASHCSGASGCTAVTPTLHQLITGVCPVNGDPLNEIDTTVTTTYSTQWMIDSIGIMASLARQSGYGYATPFSNNAIQMIEDKVGDSTYDNKYLIGASFVPIQYNPGSPATCAGDQYSTDPLFTSWGQYKTGYVASLQAQASWANSGTYYLPYSCFDHGYPLVARAIASFGQQFNVNSTNANCSGGVCSASATWSWFTQNNATAPPYYNNASWQALGSSGGCAVGGTDSQIKWALTPLVTSANGSIQTSNTIRTLGTILQ